MTENEALKILAQQEKRFKDAGFGRGIVLAKSAHDYHKAILDWRKKADACAADCNAAKKRLDAFTAELKRKEAQARKLLDDIARIRKVCVPLKKTFLIRAMSSRSFRACASFRLSSAVNASSRFFAAL